MSNFEPKSKVSIEDLLRLKRAERPSPEFWANFERELRQKQLTALVKKRHWWHDMAVMLRPRIYLPAGAAAIVAFTLVTVRYTATTRVVESENAAPQIAAIASPIETLAAIEVGAHSTDTTEPHQAKHQAPVPVATVQNPAVEVADVAELMPAMLAAREIETPSARSIAANLARLEQSEPELVNSVMGSRLSTSARVQTASVESDMEPASAADSGRKYRLIARYADRALSPEPSAPANVRERIARRLGDDLGDGISRIGVVGSRVSLKF
jgi:hypothetical protein